MGQGQPKPCSAQQMLALGLRLHQTKRGGLADGAGPEGCDGPAVGGPHGFSGFASPERERKPAPLASDTSLRQCTAARALLATLTFALPLAFGWVRIDSGVASADARNDSHRNQKRYGTRTSQGLGHGRSRQGAGVRQMRLGSGAFAALTCLAVWALVDLAKIRSARGLGYCAQLRQKDGQATGSGSNPDPLPGAWDTINSARRVFLTTAQENSPSDRIEQRSRVGCPNDCSTHRWRSIEVEISGTAVGTGSAWGLSDELCPKVGDAAIRRL